MRLSNQYRVARLSKMALSPGYSWVSSSRRVALNQEDFKNAMNKFEQDIPFGNLFGGGGVTRIVVPMVNTMKWNIEQKLKEYGYTSIDWQKGEVLKPAPPNPKAPPNAPPKFNPVKIGKALGRIPEATELLKWWSDNRETAKNDDYSIVVSRHPVDVLRMSDHRSWTSCHTPGKEHYKSCLDEMRYGGLVAYLVNTDDLQRLPPEQIAGKGEIFIDLDRNINGVKPVSRVRLRRYTHGTPNFDLAVPEMDVYGQYSTEFLEQVTDWARKVQEPITSQKRWRMKEFTRRGGQYRNEDVEDSLWFNNFFEDTLDSGDTDFGKWGKESTYMDEEAEQWENDWDDEDDVDENEVENQRLRDNIERIHNLWLNRFGNCHASYDENTDIGGGLSFEWTGEIEVALPAAIFGKADLAEVDRRLNVGDDSLVNYLAENDYPTGGKRIQPIPGVRVINFNVGVADPGGGDGDPDEYDGYCEYLHDKFDYNYERIRGLIIQWLMASGLAQSTPVRAFEGSKVQFQNFKVEVINGEMEADADGVIGLFDWDLWNESIFRHAINIQIRNLVGSELAKIIRESPPPVKEDYNLNNFTVLTTTKHGQGKPKVVLTIRFVEDDMTDQEDFQEAIELMTLVDRMFPRIVEECTVLLERFYHQRRLFLDDPVMNQFEFHPDMKWPR